MTEIYLIFKKKNRHSNNLRLKKCIHVQRNRNANTLLLHISRK